jgi:hypothetical protein
MVLARRMEWEGTYSQSRAYAERATGDYPGNRHRWFYKTEDMSSLLTCWEKEILPLLPCLPGISGVTCIIRLTGEFEKRSCILSQIV